MSTLERWENRFAREREGRRRAESILEDRSRELYAANNALEAAKSDLEERVKERTAALEKAIEGLRVEAAKRLEVQEQLRQARDSALELAELKTEFLARMSHEIRTPLNAILGLTGLLLDTPLSPGQKSHLETVRTSGQILMRIISDILDMAKIDAGKLDLEYTDVDPAAVLKPTFSLVFLDAQAKGIDIVQQSQAIMPPAIVTDGGRLQQIATNLLSNAVKYSDGGTVTVGLRVNALEDTDVPEALREEHPEGRGHWQQIEISVADEGRGIAADNIGELFESFTRVEDGADANAGSSSGLGLAICKRLCEMMGGDVTVESTLGEGSVFTVRVPAWLPNQGSYAESDQLETTNISAMHPSLAHLLASESSTKESEESLEMAQDKPLSVLLADDYDVNRMVLQSQLETLGYRADAVANGEEVLRALKARSYDVVLMDIRMPVIDGVEATRRLRKQVDGPQPYVVAVTASALKGDRDRYLESGMDDYVPKPVDISRLAAALRRAYDKRYGAGRLPWADVQEDDNPVEIHLDELRERLGPGLDLLLSKVVPVYLRELPGRLEKLGDALDDNDAEAFARYCHGLKGTSKSIGAEELAEQCSRFELAGYEDELPSSEEFDELKDLASRTAVALKKTLADRAAVT
ncbi:MAG: response regulator [Pseudomonadota bacterium]